MLRPNPLLLACVLVASSVGAPERARAETSEPAPESTSDQPSSAYPPCSHAPDEQAQAAAKGAFEAGRAAFAETEYPLAITYWEDAFRRDCTALLLLTNLAVAYEFDGQFAKAVTALTTYLERAPNAADAPAIQQRIKHLQARLQKTHPDTPEPPPEPTESEPENTPAPPPQDSTTSPVTSQDQERSLVPLYVAGAGGVVALVGGLFWYSAYSTVQEIAEACPDRGECERASEGNRARTRTTVWGIVTGVGALTAVGGVTWYLLQPDGTEPSAVAIDLKPDYAGLRWRSAF